MQRRYFLQLTQHLHTHHVSSIPNSSAPRLPQLPLRFNDSLVLRQLRYTGMLETVRIRQSGYSIKHTFQVTLSRRQSEHAPRLAVNFTVFCRRSGVRSPFSCAAASRNEPHQVRDPRILQTDPPASRRVPSGPHSGASSGSRVSVFSLSFPPDCNFCFVFFYSARCSCARRSASVCRPSSTRKC